MFGFAEYVRAGCPDAQLEPVAQELRRWLRSELRKRGHLQSPPAPLGYDGETWLSVLAGSPLSAPVADLWTHVFVERRQYLEGVVRSGNDIQGLVRRMIQQWLATRLRRHSPEAYAVAKNCEGAVAELHDSGRARWDEGGNVVLGKPPAELGKEVLEHASVRDAARSCGRVNRGAQLSLADALWGAAGGCSARFDLASLRSVVRAEVETRVTHEGLSGGVVRPANRNERYDARLRAIAGADVSPRRGTRADERRAKLAVLVRNRIPSGEDCSVRCLAGLMGVSVSTISADLVRLAEALEGDDG